MSESNPKMFFLERIILTCFFLNFNLRVCLTPCFTDELRAEQERNKMLQEDMEATLQDIQNM